MAETIEVSEVQTTDDTNTTIWSVSPEDSTYVLEALVVGRAQSGGDRTAVLFAARIKTSGGVRVSDETLWEEESDTGFNVFFSQFGEPVHTIVLRVRGLSSTTVNWRAVLRIQKLES